MNRRLVQIWAQNVGHTSLIADFLATILDSTRRTLAIQIYWEQPQSPLLDDAHNISQSRTFDGEDQECTHRWLLTHACFTTLLDFEKNNSCIHVNSKATWSPLLDDTCNRTQTRTFSVKDDEQTYHRLLIHASENRKSSCFPFSFTKSILAPWNSHLGSNSKAVLDFTHSKHRVSMLQNAKIERGRSK